jgi:hypothetical protein
MLKLRATITTLRKQRIARQTFRMHSDQYRLFMAWIAHHQTHMLLARFGFPKSMHVKGAPLGRELAVVDVFDGHGLILSGR